MHLIIDRSKWLRGEGSAASKLLRSGDRKMCCLGFYGLACGASEVDLLGRGTPAQLPHIFPKWLVNEGVVYHISTDAAATLMVTNDRTDLSDEDREKALAEVFARNGVTVEFIDGVQP